MAAVPTTCSSFVVTSDRAVTCAVTLTEGNTYSMYTACNTVKGLPILRLIDDAGTEVAYNDGFPFCGGNVTAALVEYFMPCFSYPTAVAECAPVLFPRPPSPLTLPSPPPYARFALSTECLLDTTCSGNLVVELSTKVPPEDCGRLKPPPPSTPTKPSPPGGNFCPPGGGGSCYPTVNYTFGCCPYPPQPGSSADPSESTCALTSEGGATCIYGDSCALGKPCTSSADCAGLAGYIPSCIVASCCGQPGDKGGLCFPVTDQCAPPPAAAAHVGRTAFRRATPSLLLA